MTRLLLLLLALAAPAGANPARVAPGVATSACIGEASSARCAAETLIACLARAERALCQRVGATVEAGLQPRLVEYVIERESVIRPDQISEDLRDVAWFKPGYVLVEVQLRACAPRLAACEEEEWEELQIYLRPRDARWEVVAWRASAEPDRPAELPEAFRDR